MNLPRKDLKVYGTFLAATFLLIIDPLMLPPAMADQGPSGQANESPEASPAYWESRLRDSYEIEKIVLPPNLNGRFFLVGDLTPIRARQLQPEGDAWLLRSIAEAFLLENVALFGVNAPR